MPIGEILEKAFKYPWKNRALWFYGFWLALFSGFSSFSNSYDNEQLKVFTDKVNINFDEKLMGIIVLVAILVLILSLIGVVVGSWSLGAIIKGALLADESKKVDRKEIGKVGKRTVWEIIKLTIILPILLALAFILIVIPFVILFAVLPQPAGAVIGISLGAILLLVLIPGLIYLSLIWSLAVRGLVVEKEGVIQSLKNARGYMKGKGWQTLLITLILGLVTGMASLAASLPMIILILVIVGLVSAKIYVGVAIVGILSLAYLVVFLIIQGYFQAFTQVGLTLWWKYLKAGKA